MVEIIQNETKIMNEIYSELLVARFKRSSARPTGCPVAFRIEASALGLDRNVPHTFVRALRQPNQPCEPKEDETNDVYQDTTVEIQK